MSGWPRRISRNAFGPTRSDFDEVVDDTKFLAAKYIELEHWQTAGMNLFAPKVSALIVSDALSSHEEAWAPNGGAAAPTFAHVGTGHYRLTYAASYPDQNGDSQPPALTWAKAHVQGTAPHQTSCTAVGNVVDVYLENDAGSGVDADVLVEAG